MFVRAKRGQGLSVYKKHFEYTKKYMEKTLALLWIIFFLKSII
ncbi:Uncharacterized protein dnm_089870 [Desulfonema magnum]|uniref:Uncharacterized protein n=1 Tax=Desulfonema magnum TaxID=45655 RepID=A0A975GTB3_9BACT|nr:Uncharacterized protein dnm_089870 [Desulfonema magnum]